MIHQEDNDDRLRSLFDAMPLDAPTVDFERRLMAKVHREVAKRRQRARVLSVACLAIASIVVIALPVVVFGWMGQPMEVQPPDMSINMNIDMSTEWQMPTIAFPPLVVAVSVVAVAMLVGDLFVRRWIGRRQY